MVSVAKNVGTYPRVSFGMAAASCNSQNVVAPCSLSARRMRVGPALYAASASGQSLNWR